jgi:hypothetical protein
VLLVTLTSIFLLSHGSSAKKGSTVPGPSAPTVAPAQATPVSQSCVNPEFSTSDPHGIWRNEDYFVFNNMWGVAGYQVRQSLYACGYNNWYVEATMDNKTGDGHVKTYPNVQKNFGTQPIRSFKSITSTFSEISPHVGIYDNAYDIWINGVASPGSTELMIWNENHNQVPGGSEEGRVDFDGRTYAIWKGDHYIALVAQTPFTSGTVNLLGMFDWLMARHWIPDNSALDQIDYGVELVSTNGSSQRFSFNNFSISTS